MSAIVGDVLLSAAFLAYGGFLDLHYREVMWREWSTHLSEASIKFNPELSFPDYLSTADETDLAGSRSRCHWIVFAPRARSR